MSPTPTSIRVTDEKPCFALSGANVEIFVTSERSGQDHGSSRVKLKNIVDYKWEVKKYHGRLIAVHRDGQVIAYSIKLKTGGGVRVVWNGERALIKGMSNEVLDLQFAHMSSKVILACVDESSLHVYRVDTSSPGKLDTQLLLKVENAAEDVPVCSHRINWCPFVPSTAPSQAQQAMDTHSTNTNTTTTTTTTTGASSTLAAAAVGDDDTDGAEEDYANHLLVWSQGDTFQALNVHLVVEAHGAGTYDYAELSEGVVQHQENTSTITVATFSPDGTTLAVGFADGNVYFYQIYLYSKETAPRRLYHWRPHDSKPVTALAFLDDHTVQRSSAPAAGAGGAATVDSSSTAGSFWKHALTATENNTEIKLWRCDDWSCIQRICFTPTALGASLDFKLDIDASSTYLVLSEQKSRVLYALQIDKQPQEGEKATVAFRSVAEFPLSSSILSFNIAGATKGKYHCGRLEDDDDLEDDEGDADSDPIFGVMLQMFLVQPKSVQECQVFFQTESAAQPENGGDKLRLASGVEDMELSTPDHKAPAAPDVMKALFGMDISPAAPPSSTSAARQKSSAQINLMTPESFQSPAQQPPPSTDQNVSNSVLTTIRMLAAASASSAAAVASAGTDPQTPKPESMLSYSALEEQNKSLRMSLSVAVDQPPPSSSTSMSAMNPIASSTVNNSEILPSGNSSPSREVQEILSLKDEMFENHLQSSDLDLELEANSSGGGGNGTEEDGEEQDVFEGTDDDVVEDDDDEEDEEATLGGKETNMAAAVAPASNHTQKVLEGIEAIKLYVDDDEMSSSSNNLEWPKVPNILPDMARIGQPPLPESTLNGGEAIPGETNRFSMNNLNASGSAAVESKLDRILDMLSRNSEQIVALERRFGQWEQQQQEKSLHNSSSSSIEVVQMPTKSASVAAVSSSSSAVAAAAAAQLSQEKLNKSLDSHLTRCEHMIKYELDDVQKRQTKQLNILRDQMVQTVNQVIRQQFTEKFASGGGLFMELQPQLLKLVAREMENIKGMLQYEVANKLSTCDNLLRENLNYVCTNKSLMESFAAAIRSGVQHTVQVTFLEQINKLIVPAYERATKEMFKQTNDMFQKGVTNYTKQVHSYMTQFQPVHDQQERLLTSMKALPEQFKVTNEKVINSFSAQILHEVNKDFKTLQLNVLKLIKEAVRQEVSKGFESQVASLEDSVLSAVRSQAQTPSVFDIKEQIRHLIDAGQVNKAFHQALISNDLNLVEFTLEAADIKEVFNPCHLEQTVLLSLIQQLSADMTAYTGTKHQYLSEAITSLNMSDTVIREHAPKILKQLSTNLHKYTEDHPNGQFGSRIKMLVMMIQGFTVHLS